ncbi:MAG TPA: SRPBCC family protein [Roseiflexaceae bacterium]|jgi:uncharacterized protein YndB with AHSA1/START domain|nr:SRPBCC family protein [Roseiflexaceae bacterium]
MAHSHAEEDINAPAETVWSILSDLSKWPLWFPGIQTAPGASTVQTGTSFQWQDENHTDTGMITRADPNQLLQVTTRHGDRQATHTFKLDQHGGLFGGGGKTRVDYTLEYDVPGGIIGNFVVNGNPFDMTRMNHTLDKIKSLAEGQAGHS